MLIQLKNKDGKVLFSYDIAGNNHRHTLRAAGDSADIGDGKCTDVKSI